MAVPCLVPYPGMLYPGRGGSLLTARPAVADRTRPAVAGPRPRGAPASPAAFPCAADRLIYSTAKAIRQR